MSKKTIVQLSKVNQLQAELFNLLKENIPFLVKLEIRNIIDSFKSEVENLQTTVKELYEKYGTEEEGGLKIKKEHIVKADQELKLLYAKEIEIKGKLSKENLKELKSETAYFFVFDLVV